MRLGIVVAALTGLICLTGCSVKFAYNNVDRLLRWQVSDYVNLNSEQKDRLVEDIDELMAWHRAQHLPQYVLFAHGIAQTWSDGVTEQQIADMFEHILVWGNEIQERGEPIATALLVSLSDAQVAALPAKLERSNIEIEEDEIDTSLVDIQEHWAEEFADGLERFTGRLAKDQKSYITRRAVAYQPEAHLWMQYRRRWQADLLVLLEKRNDTGFAQKFDALVAARDTYYGETFVRVSGENITLARQMAAHLLSNMSAKQSQRFVEALTDLAEDFAELAEQDQN